MLRRRNWEVISEQKEKRLGENEQIKSQKPIGPLLAGLALIVAALLVAVSWGNMVGEQHAKESAGDGPQGGVDLEHPSLGDENAPVVLIEYADYQ